MAVMERGIPRFLVALGCFLAGWGVLFAIQGGAIAMVALPDTYSWGDALEEVLVGFLPGLLFGLVAAGLLILMDACLADRLPLNQLLPVGVLAGACWASAILALGVLKMAGFGRLSNHALKMVEIALAGFPFAVLGLLKVLARMRARRAGV